MVSVCCSCVIMLNENGVFVEKDSNSTEDSNFEVINVPYHYSTISRSWCTSINDSFHIPCVHRVLPTFRYGQFVTVTFRYCDYSLQGHFVTGHFVTSTFCYRTFCYSDISFQRHLVTWLSFSLPVPNQTLTSTT